MPVPAWCSLVLYITAFSHPDHSRRVTTAPSAIAREWLGALVTVHTANRVNLATWVRVLASHAYAATSRNHAAAASCCSTALAVPPQIALITLFHGVACRCCGASGARS